MIQFQENTWTDRRTKGQTDQWKDGRTEGPSDPIS